MLAQGRMMFTDLAQGDLDGAGNVHPCAFRWRAYPPRPSAKPDRTSQLVGEKVELVGEPLAPAQVMKLLRLGQFRSQLGQTLLVGRSRLRIKDFPGIAEPFGVVEWQARVLKEIASPEPPHLGPHLQ